MFLVVIAPYFQMMAQERVTIQNGSLSFQKPNNVIIAENFDWNSLDGKMWCGVDILDEQYLRDEPEYMVSESLFQLLQESQKITKNDFLKLLKDNKNFYTAAITRFAMGSDLPASYRVIYFQGIPVGEFNFSTTYDGLIVPASYTYNFTIVFGDTLAKIYMGFIDDDEYSIVKELTDYFTTRDGSFYWKNREAVGLFYQQLDSDAYKSLPKPLQALREARDLILRTLEIKQEDGSIIKNVEVRNPRDDYRKTHVTTENLRLRETATIFSLSLTTLPKGTDVEVLETGATETIGGITAPWVKVRTENGLINWCFSGYLKEL
jgi:hypothetical protein